MDIERSRFLWLTASLAAVACNQSQVATPSDPDNGARSEHSVAEPSGRGDAADPARSKGQGALASESADGPPSVWLEIPPGSEDPEEPPSSCDDDPPQPLSCRNLEAPAGHCESFDATFALCNSFPTVLQPRAANAAVECVLAESGRNGVCDWTLWQTCTDAGVSAACIEPRTRPICDTISSSCGGSLDVFACQQAVSAVRPRHHDALASCVQEFCEVSFCVSNLAQF